MNIRVLARLSLACLIAGFGLLNIADGNWAHVRRVACLIGFVVLGFGAVVLSALDEQPSNR